MEHEQQQQRLTPLPSPSYERERPEYHAIHLGGGGGGGGGDGGEDDDQLLHPASSSNMIASSNSSQGGAGGPPPPLIATPSYEKAEFSSKYGGYGSSTTTTGEQQDGGGVEDEKQGLLLAGGSPRNNSNMNGTARWDVLVPKSAKGESSSSSTKTTRPKLLSLVVLLLGGLFILSKVAFTPSARQGFHSVSPYLSESFFALINPEQGPSAPHPIIPLIATANATWDTLVGSQSKSLERATRIYKSRYQRLPPPGFDKWFYFATMSRNHSLVDEYDQLMADLDPFRSLSPTELKRRTAELAQIPGISIVSIRDGVAQVHSKSGRWAPALAMQQMIAAFAKDLPDMDIAVNEKPEGRVLPRKQRVVRPDEYGAENDVHQLEFVDPIESPSLTGFTAEWKRDGSVWEVFKRACPVNSPSRRIVESVRAAELSTSSLLGQVPARAGKSLDGFSRRRPSNVSIPSARDLTFNSDADASYDICSRPSIHSLHSAFFSNQRSIEFLYPVFSPSKPAGYGDILIPSHNYWAPSSEFTYEFELKRGRTSEPSDMAWAKKRPTVFWRGKVTRGADTPPGHASSFQKQRLVKMTNDPTSKLKKVLVAYNATTGALSSMTGNVPAINQATTDIAMACDPKLGECAYLRSLGYMVAPPGPLSDAWKHKLVLDLDEIGFSPRFLALMESYSAVVKSSVQREFWHGWIVPWKHYIPLSSSYAELYNIQTFFAGLPKEVLDDDEQDPKLTQLTQPMLPLPLPKDSEGNTFHPDAALEAIGLAGREWKQKHMRKADMEVYVYRLMIEYAAILTAPEVDETSSVAQEAVRL